MIGRSVALFLVNKILTFYPELLALFSTRIFIEENNLGKRFLLGLKVTIANILVPNLL